MPLSLAGKGVPWYAGHVLLKQPNQMQKVTPGALDGDRIATLVTGLWFPHLFMTKFVKDVVKTRTFFNLRKCHGSFFDINLQRLKNFHSGRNESGPHLVDRCWRIADCRGSARDTHDAGQMDVVIGLSYLVIP
eukprot:4725938-Prymnesium_polylepis.1